MTESLRLARSDRVQLATVRAPSHDQSHAFQVSLPQVKSVASSENMAPKLLRLNAYQKGDEPRGYLLGIGL